MSAAKRLQEALKAQSLERTTSMTSVARRLRAGLVFISKNLMEGRGREAWAHNPKDAGSNPAPQPALLFVCKGLLEQGKPFAFGFTTQWSGGLANTPAW